MNENISGLTAEEVRRRCEHGECAAKTESITKSRPQIVKENICTLFNLLNFIIALLLFGVGAYTNMVFIAIIILNISIGIAQEFKAKKLVDELSILNRPSVCVRRDGTDVNIELEEIVKDDIMVLGSGNQICNDAVVVDGMLEVNESLLTGESDAVIKEQGAELFSGSSVISGRAYAKVTHVGNDNYATRLANEVKKEKQVVSELLSSMKKVTRFTSFLIVPLGVLLFLEAYCLRGATIYDSVVSSSAALLGMLPKGLVLLISVSLAAGVIRLAKMKILVQNIYSLETLAHVDTLCLDKTGTITNGRLTVASVVAMSNRTRIETEKLVRSYLAASDDNNATFQALKSAFDTEAVFKPCSRIAFSSKRKWGCVSFEGMGSVFVGAPDKLYGTLPDELERELDNGRRLITISYTDRQWSDDEALPDDLEALYCVVLEDTIRDNTKETLEFFRNEGVDVKVISGDHIKTVSMIAGRAGLARWSDAVDMSTLGDDIDYDEISREYAVFAWVTPKQKQQLVLAMKRQGHSVAMTGDGVNDLLALREADCSIAVADGSDASRQIAQVVLLDSNFTNLPQVVMEGRRVVNNVTRTASVFFIKTIYSVLVSIICLIANIPFPFIPIQITVIDGGIEGWPSFLTIFETDIRKLKGSFLRTSLTNALPFAIVIALMVTAISVAAPFHAAERQTVMYYLLIVISMVAVFKSCMPFNSLRYFVCITMVLGTFGGLMLLPGLFEITAFTNAMTGYFAMSAALSLAALLVLHAVVYAAIPKMSLQSR